MIQNDQVSLKPRERFQKNIVLKWVGGRIYGEKEKDFNCGWVGFHCPPPNKVVLLFSFLEPNYKSNISFLANAWISNLLGRRNRSEFVFAVSEGEKLE